MVVKLADMSPAERQAFAEFLAKEIFRHVDDIKRGLSDLEELEKRYGVQPRYKYIDKWIEVQDEKP